MFKSLFGAAAIVSALALSVTTIDAQAAIVPFKVQLQTDTTAVAEATADANSDTSPPSASPLVSSSVVVGTTDFASAGAIAADGLLSTSAEAFSDRGFSSGVGSARYLASFAGAFSAMLHLEFDTTDFTDAEAASLATAILLVVNDGITVLEEVITLSGLYDFTVDFTTGANQSIDLILTSEAYTLTGGSAGNFANVSIGVVLLPEPGSLALGFVALIALVALGTRRSNIRSMSTETVSA